MSSNELKRAEQGSLKVSQNGVELSGAIPPKDLGWAAKVLGVGATVGMVIVAVGAAAAMNNGQAPKGWLK